MWRRLLYGSLVVLTDHERRLVLDANLWYSLALDLCTGVGARMERMDLVSNNEGRNHKTLVQKLMAARPKSLCIVSPFLSQDMHSMLSEFDFSGVQEFVLITTFKKNDREQLHKPFQLRDVYRFFDESFPDIKVEMHINNSLHGKLYFFDFPDESRMIISSANFTRNGFENNSEWGLMVFSPEIIQQAREEVGADIDYEQLTRLQVRKACDHASLYREKNLGWVTEPDPVEIDILKYVASSEDAANVSPRYYLKPIGHTEERIWKDERRDFSDKVQPLHFSTARRPTGIKKGDYLITTAIGAGSLLSYFRVTGTPEWVTDEELKIRPGEERWRWYLEAENLSRTFGGSWWEYDLLRNELSDEFNRLYPGVSVTKAGGFNLRSINYGSDKLELTPEFGRFLIERIDAALA